MALRPNLGAEAIFAEVEERVVKKTIVPASSVRELPFLSGVYGRNVEDQLRAKSVRDVVRKVTGVLDAAPKQAGQRAAMAVLRYLEPIGRGPRASKCVRSADGSFYWARDSNPIPLAYLLATVGIFWSQLARAYQGRLRLAHFRKLCEGILIKRREYRVGGKRTWPTAQCPCLQSKDECTGELSVAKGLVGACRWITAPFKQIPGLKTAQISDVPRSGQRLRQKTSLGTCVPAPETIDPEYLQPEAPTRHPRLPFKRPGQNAGVYVQDPDGRRAHRLPSSWG